MIKIQLYMTIKKAFAVARPWLSWRILSFIIEITHEPTYSYP